MLSWASFVNWSISHPRNPHNYWHFFLYKPVKPTKTMSKISSIVLDYILCFILYCPNATDIPFGKHHFCPLAPLEPKGQKWCFQTHSTTLFFFAFLLPHFKLCKESQCLTRVMAKKNDASFEKTHCIKVFFAFAVKKNSFTFLGGKKLSSLGYRCIATPWVAICDLKPTRATIPFMKFDATCPRQSLVLIHRSSVRSFGVGGRGPHSHYHGHA